MKLQILLRALLTGFIGGLFWCSISIGLYYFNFLEVSPKTYVLRSWLQSGWTDTWVGDIVSILFVSILSMVVALIYYSLLKKVNSIWIGVLFGTVLWVFAAFVLHPLFSNVQSLFDFSIDTIISTLCLFVLYGTFIGYSISFDYYDMVIKADKASDP